MDNHGSMDRTEIERLRIELAESRTALAELRERVDDAQRLANMGDYDWHIVTDKNSWSDQLYRIYGHEPGSFNASYERFLSMVHPDDRDTVTEMHRQAYQQGGSWQVTERIVRPDGEVRHLATNGVVVTDDNGNPIRMRGTCVDITERVSAERESEELAASLREWQVRRRQAFEINDNVVQGISAAVLALQLDDLEGAESYLERTLKAARRMMGDLLLDRGDEAPEPGLLVRSAPVSPELDDAGVLAPTPSIVGTRVLIADDYSDMRRLLRVQLERAGVEVVGEAGDGAETVARAAELAPDVILMDLAMPVKDGLQALPEIRAVAPGATVIVLSGFASSLLEEKALAAGATRFLEKGVGMDVVGAIEALALVR
ncbi:response regulator [Nocardioides humilatus]|uniref:histidine kinase n=1 Tax=Nocardioides humilatus TaxID=2607660 RepID=A0A5B1L8G4_9ACTN|nr:response regulator [Nocardioides humilatus]KAA1415977.1 response regulator [Nocardioides humilatus]